MRRKVRARDEFSGDRNRVAPSPSDESCRRLHPREQLRRNPHPAPEKRIRAESGASMLDPTAYLSSKPSSRVATAQLNQNPLPSQATRTGRKGRVSVRGCEEGVRFSFHNFCASEARLSTV